MARTRHGIEMDQARLKKFSRRVIEACRSRKSFRKQMEVDYGHIMWSAANKGQGVRLSFDNETIASVIVRGVLNETKSKPTGRIEAAFDAVVIAFRCTDWDAKEEIKIDKLALRAVVRETKPKMLVVTIYPDNGSGDFDLNSIPEISNDVWND